MPTESTKDTSIHIRATTETKQQIDRAASLLGTDRTNFILQTVMERALEVIERHNTVTLSDRDRDTFLDLLEEETPNENLQDAAHTRRKLLSD